MNLYTFDNGTIIDLERINAIRPICEDTICFTFSITLQLSEQVTVYEFYRKSSADFPIDENKKASASNAIKTQRKELINAWENLK